MLEDLEKLRLDDDEKPDASGRGSGVGWLGLLVVLLLGAAAGFIASRFFPAGEEGLPVRTAIASKETGRRVMSGRKETGWIEVPDDRYPLYITALTTGRLEDVSLRKGMTISKGQPVARVYEDYLKGELERTDGELAGAEQALAKLVAGYRKQEVAQAKARADRAAAVVDRTAAEIDSARALIDARKAEVEIARVTYERQKQLLGGDVVSQQVLDEHKAKYDASKARLQVAVAAERAARAELVLTKAEHEDTLQGLALVREGFRKEEIQAARAEVARLRAVRDLAKLAYDNRVIVSPWDGVILNQFKRAGDMVAYPGKGEGPNPIVASLYDPKDLQARIQVDLDRVKGVRPGQKVLISTEVEGAAVTYDGVVLRRDPEADYRNNIVWVKVKIEDPSANLQPEMVCKAQFLEDAPDEEEAGELPPRILVPKEAVVKRGGRSFVFLVVSGRARLAPVEAGESEGPSRIITKGLEGGEEVVTGGHEALSDGAPVRKVTE